MMKKVFLLLLITLINLPFVFASNNKDNFMYRKTIAIDFLGFWQLESLVFRFDFAFAKTSLHKLSRTDALTSLRASQNPLDGVLDEYTGKYDENKIPDIRNGAKDFIIKLSKDYKLILFTTRESSKAKDWLIENDINQYFSEITNIKPPAYIYLDDRALKFDGNYDKTLEEIKNYKAYWKN